MSNKNGFIKILVLAVILILMGGLFFVGKNKDNDKMADIQKEWNTYKNDNLQISFEYPASWGEVILTSNEVDLSGCSEGRRGEKTYMPPQFEYDNKITFSNKKEDYVYVGLVRFDQSYPYGCAGHSKFDLLKKQKELENMPVGIEELSNGWKNGIFKNDQGNNVSYYPDFYNNIGTSISQIYELFGHNLFIQAWINYNPYYGSPELGESEEYACNAWQKYGTCGLTEWLRKGKLSEELRKDFSGLEHVVRTIKFTKNNDGESSQSSGENIIKDFGDEEIIVTSPKPNQVVSSPITIEGYINDFGDGWEGDFGRVALYDDSGKELADASMSVDATDDEGKYKSGPLYFKSILILDKPLTKEGVLTFMQHCAKGGDCGDDFNVPVKFSDKFEKSSIAVTYPNGNEVFKSGETYVIKWDTKAIPADEEVTIWADAQVHSRDELIGSVKNTGSYSWTVPDNIIDGEYKIRISFTWQVKDLSDEPIKIVRGDGAQHYVRIISPNGGEELKDGDTYNIEWETLGFSDSSIVNIFLKRLSDGSDNNIASVKNTGSFDWKVANEDIRYKSEDGMYLIFIYILDKENGVWRGDFSDNRIKVY